jgi:3-hydroxyisobutyrate dehydrogenase
MGSESSVRICVVGVGRMGLPLCANFVGAGHSVIAFDARPGVAAAVRGAGARWEASLADAVSGAEIVVSMLPTAESTVEVAEAAMPLMTAGAVWIDMGSNTPATSAALLRSAEARRIDVLDAPVGGGPSAAMSGTLQLFVGGSRAVFERHRPVLESVADPGRTHYLGTHGCGYVAKLLVNLLWFGQAIAMTEALLLAQESGVDLSSMYAALQRSAVAGRFVDTDLRALLGGDYLTTFGLEGCYEELAAVCNLAADTGTPFAVSGAVTDIYRQALDSFGAVDGELMGAAFLEMKAGRSLRADLSSARITGSTPADDRLE